MKHFISSITPRIASYCLLALIFTGCITPLQKKKRIPACRELMALIGTNWHRDPGTGIYRMLPHPDHKLDYEIIARQECFSDLMRRDIERLLGKPDTVDRGSLVYFLGTPCLEGRGFRTQGCQYLECIMGSDNRVKGVTIVHDSFME